MFAIGRLPGWLAHWKEMVESPDNRIGRPRQIYTGELEHDYISLSERS
jgi:citrate synthase